ncbi:serine protease [Ruminococcus sp. OA3]|uniref:SDH family Clp fold serine proteinase n=1 Tax=Ruminococcus sp. OA3 TaxID=2914164 RepID=UPI001F053C61|nr:serine protease [Ruminococcus sp. OA3]MCH1984565.1 serine protease [Ruminococcus sp. OA3]
MPGWNEILDEVHSTKSQYDYVRTKYLRQLSEYTKRNTIAYYSSFLTKSADGIEIADIDMTGFMNAVRGMDCSLGLDLILHTPGGSPTAAETIVNYLRDKFNNDIRVIVPQLAMSAGTMIACSAKEIIMGRQSSLGPIDPQFNGIPAYNIKMEFEEAKADLAEHPENAQYWAIKLQQYPAAFMKSAIDAIELSGKLLEEWLGSCMFDANFESDREVISRIVSKLNEHNNSKNHGRHLSLEFCRNIGLKISQMEDEPSLQDLILSVHHSYMITLTNSDVIKIIENHDNKAYIAHFSGA